MIIEVMNRKTGGLRGKVEVPDGATREEIKQIIRKKFNAPPEQEVINLSDQVQDKPSLLKRLGSQFAGGQEEILGATSRLLGIKPRETEPVREAAGIPEHLARFAGEMTAPIGGVPGAGVPGAIGRAFTATPAYPPIKKAIAGVGGIAKEGLSSAANLLASIPRKHFKLALEKDIFKGKPRHVPEKEFQDVGKLAQKAINYIQTQAGKEVRKEDVLLSKISRKYFGKEIPFIKTRGKMGETELVPPKDYVKKVEELSGFFKRGKMKTDLLQAKDRRMLGRVKEVMEGDPEIVDIQDLKKLLQDFSSYSPESVKSGSPRGKYIFKEIAKDLKESIEKVSPALGKANIKSHQAQTLRDELKTVLKNKSVTRKIKNIENQEPYTLDLLEQLDKIAPQEYKFMEKAKVLSARKSFEPFFPGRGGGSGGPQGVANIGRALLGTAATPIIPLMSPQIQQSLLRGGRRGVSAYGKTAPYISPVIKKAVTRKLIRANAPEKNQDGTFSNNFKRQLIRDDPRRRI